MKTAKFVVVACIAAAALSAAAAKQQPKGKSKGANEPAKKSADFSGIKPAAGWSGSSER